MLFIKILLFNWDWKIILNKKCVIVKYEFVYLDKLIMNSYSVKKCNRNWNLKMYKILKYIYFRFNIDLKFEIFGMCMCMIY